MLRQQYDTFAVVSARVHAWFLLYSFEFFLQVDALRTVSTRQNKECLTKNELTPAVLSARAHTGCYFGDMQFFLQADNLQTLPTHQKRQSLAKPNECDASVIQMTVSTMLIALKPGSQY